MEEKLRALFLWHQHLQGNGLPFTGPILQEKVLRCLRVLKGENSEFTASEGCLDRFKKQFGIRQINISEETLSADKEVVLLFKDYLALT